MIRWVWGRSANGSPTGQLSISRRVDLAASARRSADPLAVERRQQQLARRMCGASSRVRTEFGPSAGSSTVAFASPAWKTAGSPVNTCFDQLRAGDVDDAAEVGEADAEEVAVAALRRRR